MGRTTVSSAGAEKLAPTGYSRSTALIADARLPLILLALFAVATRLGGISIWSLWEDEGTSVYFAARPTSPFPSYFPIYFYLLRGWTAVAGSGVGTMRFLSAAIGLATLLAAYLFTRKWFGSRAAFYAGLAMTLSLGHLFWSQSIRYYILLLLFQIGAMWLYVEGMERRRPGYLLLSCVLLLLGVFTHFSVVLVFPVFIAHAVSTAVLPDPQGRYRLREYLWFGVPFAVVCLIFGWRYSSFQEHLGHLTSTHADAPDVGAMVQSLLPSLMLRTVIYQGPVTIALALMALPLVGRRARSRVFQFIWLAAFLPLAELAVLATRNSVTVLWYQALFAVFGLSVLAGIAVAELAERRGVWAERLGVAALLLGGLPFFVGYDTTMHGDRPRWEEAAQEIRSRVTTADLDAGRTKIVSTVAVVTNFYLGISADNIQSHPWVIPFNDFWRKRAEMSGDYWVVAERAVLNDEERSWLEERGKVVGTKPAVSGPKDRTLYVYRMKLDKK